MKLEDFLTLYADPGEDTGWCLSRGQLLLSAGTEKMWDFADQAWIAVNDELPIGELYNADLLRDGVDSDHLLHYPIGRIVSEDFKLYPWALQRHELDWNPVRTARLIGALKMIARIRGLDFVLQDAKIKEMAIAAGAEEFFYHPLKENRHQNDAIMHYVYYSNLNFR